MARSAVVAKLSKYRAKRDFGITAEPAGERSEKHRERATRHAGDSFVIQQHAARRLHYDFRLELDGVLLSWSVPKGPSLSPTERRLAVRTEDHPLDYAGFEGIIPQGQYGGGTVVVWDQGTWQPEADAQEGMRKGRLTFTLEGHKLHGRWHLVRTKLDAGKTENWLLFKGRDDAASDKVDIVTAEPKSVISGRTLDEVAAAQDRVWQSDRAPEPTVMEKRAARFTKGAQGKPRSRASAGSLEPEMTPQDLKGLVAQLPLGFKLSNLDRVLYPEQGLTKAQLIAYLAVAADWMLPHVKERPLTIVRCPEGRAKPCFFQKKILPGSPKAIDTVKIKEETGATVDYMQIHDMPGLVALAQLGTLEIHTWGCHTDKVERPDLMVFDIDPDVGLGWEKVALAAFELRRRLRDLGFDSFVKTTGGKGLHVVAPTDRRTSWDDFKAFTKAIADQMAEDEPQLYTTNMAKPQRKNRIYLDYLRNGRNATFIAPYSQRARPGAPVAVPITWEELAHGVDPGAFTILTVPQRLARLDKDPWDGINDLKQPITAAAWKKVGGKP